MLLPPFRGLSKVDGISIRLSWQQVVSTLRLNGIDWGFVMIERDASLCADDGSYRYSRLELTPNVFANLLIALYDGKQFNRQDAISTIMKYHIDHGGVAGKSSYASVFKKATQGFLRESLSNPGYGVWLLRHKTTSIESYDEGKVVEEDSSRSTRSFEVEKTLGDGTGSVYVYYYDAYRQLAALNGSDVWPCKVGMSNGNAISRIIDQAGTAYPEIPRIALLINCDSARDMETAMHSILKLRGRWMEDAPGSEWFLTNPNEVESLFHAICENA